jgi:hypothetical protein
VNEKVIFGTIILQIMSVYQVKILGEEHQEFVDNILKALVDKKLVEISERKQELLSGENLDNSALIKIVEDSLATQSFSAEQAKELLHL